MNKDNVVDISTSSLWNERHDDMAKKGMEKFGFYIHVVPKGDDQSPTGFNAHSHGLSESFKHLDIQIVVPLPKKIALGVFHSVVDLIREGARFKVGKRYSNIILNYDVMFIPAIECNRKVLRMILPDPQGNLLKEDINDKYALQYVLKKEI